MRFVHLTGHKRLGRIKKNGLRQGSGRRGRGVYCVPLFHVPRYSFKDPDELDYRPGALDLSVPLTSGTLWKFLFGRINTQGRGRPAAVVFTPPSRCWPIDVFVLVGPEVAVRFLDGLTALAHSKVLVDKEDEQLVRDGAAQGWSASLGIQVANSTSLGFVLDRYLHAGARVSFTASDEIEVVFRSHIPATAIEKIIPLYRTNAEWKKKKQRDAQFTDDWW